MITLLNGCYCSELKVHPKNWKTSKASLKEDWYVYYRFHDPCYRHEKRFAKGKLVLLKKMNSFKTLEDRKQQTQVIMEAERLRLEEGYNPITGLSAITFTAAPVKASTPFLEALKEAEKRISGSRSTKRDLKSILNFITTAVAQLALTNTPIGSISRKHIKMLLAQIEANQDKESAHRYNKT